MKVEMNFKENCSSKYPAIYRSNSHPFVTVLAISDTVGIKLTRNYSDNSNWEFDGKTEGAWVSFDNDSAWTRLPSGSSVIFTQE